MPEAAAMTAATPHTAEEWLPILLSWTDGRSWATTDEVAGWLWRSRSTVYNLITDRKLDSYRAGNQHRISLVSVAAYFADIGFIA